MWDNRAVLHRGRRWDAARHRRVMRLTTVAGEGPTADPPYATRTPVWEGSFRSAWGWGEERVVRHVEDARARSDRPVLRSPALGRGRNPIERRPALDGDISCRIASNTTLN